MRILKDFQLTTPNSCRTPQNDPKTLQNAAKQGGENRGAKQRRRATPPAKGRPALRDAERPGGSGALLIAEGRAPVLTTTLLRAPPCGRAAPPLLSSILLRPATIWCRFAAVCIHLTRFAWFCNDSVPFCSVLQRFGAVLLRSAAIWCSFSRD